MNVFYPGRSDPAETAAIAALVARNAINSNPEILKDYELDLYFSDTQVGCAYLDCLILLSALLLITTEYVPIVLQLKPTQV